MNKYEKALDDLWKASSRYTPKTIGILDKLVERATLKKPILEAASYWCPCCKNEVDDVSFCPNCGQRLESNNR